MDGPSIAALEAALRREWLSPREARQLAGVSYGWLRQLGERKQIATLATPLGRLYRRADVERVRAARAAGAAYDATSGPAARRLPREGATARHGAA